MGLVGLLDPIRDMYLERFLVESSWMVLLMMVTIVGIMYAGWEISSKERDLIVSYRRNKLSD
ncbi:MAG: hypothetical protein AAF902_03925 [Chloroflexota bacterium]